MSAAENLDIEVEYLAALDAERRALADLVNARDAYLRAQHHRLDVYRQRDHRIIAREEATKLERAVSSKVSPDPSLAPTSSAPTSAANTSDGLPPAMHGRPER